MNIIATQYTLNNKAYEIYLAGCSANPHCEGCHNPESWDFNLGESYDSAYKQRIYNAINDFDSLINNIWILGGEPLDQDLDELTYMLYDLRQLKKKIWLFTRYNLSHVQRELKDHIEAFDYIKCGAYVPELATDNNIQYGIKLATSNQRIYERGIDY